MAMGRRMARAVAAMTLFVLVMGVLVVATESGDACGFDWPYCGGKLYPDPSNVKQVIEYTHRLVTGLLGLVVVANAAVAFHPAVRRRGGTGLALGLVALLFLQAGVGGLNVLLGTPKGFTTLDVMISEALWAAVMIYLARREADETALSQKPAAGDRTALKALRRWAAVLTAAVYGTLVLGGFFKHSALAEVFFGLEPERVWLRDPGLARSVYVLHGTLGLSATIAAAALGVATAHLTIPLRRRFWLPVAAASTLLVLEVGIGFVVVVAGLKPFWVAAHMILATLSLGATAFLYGSVDAALRPASVSGERTAERGRRPEGLGRAEFAGEGRG